MEKLGWTGLVCSNPQAVFAIVAMAMPKGDPFHLVADFRAVNQHLEAVPSPHLSLKQAADFFVSASYFATLDRLQEVLADADARGRRGGFAMVTQ